MFEKILYPTDFSGLSKDSLDVLKEGFPGHDVVVLHVMDTKVMDFSDRYAPEVFAGIEKNVEENARKKLKAIEENLTDKGFAVTVRLERGVPFREILRVAEEEEVSLIIIGSHGMSNVAEMLLGSVSEKVVRKSKSPVLVIKR
jgi:nucleotide-binding universal stress UspA family protein